MILYKEEKEKGTFLLKFLSHNAEETENFAYEFAKSVKSPQIICLTGDLGAGKTAFTRGFARGKRMAGIKSPTRIATRKRSTTTCAH